MATRKILVLHGYSQNAVIFSKRMGAIRKSCGKDIDFVFVDAPHILQPADLVGLSSNALNATEIASKPLDPAEIPRGWWKTNPERTKATGVEESLAVLKGLLIKDRYEGVFGFSQGAAMAALLSALLERPHLHPPFIADGAAPHPPMKFCVAVSGFKILADDWPSIFAPAYTTPTLHVLGANDVVVVPERSQSLIDVSANARVIVHDGGHFVPSKLSWRNFFRDYFHDPLGNVPAPLGPSSIAGTPIASVPGSVVVTPAEAEVSPIALRQLNEVVRDKITNVNRL